MDAMGNVHLDVRIAVVQVALVAPALAQIHVQAHVLVVVQGNVLVGVVMVVLGARGLVKAHV